MYGWKVVTLTVADVKRSTEYYRDQLGFQLEWDAAPQFAMLRIGTTAGGTVGLLHWSEAKKKALKQWVPCRAGPSTLN